MSVKVSTFVEAGGLKVDSRPHRLCRSQECEETRGDWLGGELQSS